MNENKSRRKNGTIQYQEHVNEVFSGAGVYYLGPFDAKGVRQKGVFATFSGSGVGIVEGRHSGQFPNVADDDLKEDVFGVAVGSAVDDTVHLQHGDTSSLVRFRIHIMTADGMIECNFIQEAKNI